MSLSTGGPVLVVALLAVLLGAACAPDTHVLDERRHDPATPRSGNGAASGPDPGPTSHPPPGTGPPGPPPDPPEWLRFTLSLAADCVRVQAEATAPVTAEVRFQAAGQIDLRPLGGGASVFDQAFRLSLPAGAEADAVVAIAAAFPLDGASSTPARFRVPAPPSLPLVITELLPNPAGAETGQEYVELRNLGAVPAVLDGLAIEDEGGRDPLPAGTLAPGASALVVGAGFVAGASGDLPPRAGTPLLRVAGRIGRDGLRQQGEAVRLIAADGSVISSYGGYVDTTRPAWSGRSIQRLPDPAACDHPQSWSMAPLDPTPGW
jgi:hypothetical protein